MALDAFSQTSSEEPILSLLTSLYSFENTLSKQEKEQFHAYGSTPDPSNIIAFVAKIDTDNSSRASRCVAPRLHTFLDRVQQFVGVVDTFVNVKPQIAAPLWGSIKLSILLASHVSSYFEKVTHLLMKVGRTCPIYQQFGHLYPGSLGLQASLCEHYAIIIRMCTRIVEVSRRKPTIQALFSMWSPFDAEFGPFQHDLENSTRAVESQISFASKLVAQDTALLVKMESKENARHRRMSLKFHKDTRAEQSEVQKLRRLKCERDIAKMQTAIRTNLSDTNHGKPWRQAMHDRFPGTAEWFQQDSEFLKWKDSGTTTLLWCIGNMGSGKTVLVSNIIAYLHSASDSSNVICFFFCRFDLGETLQARNILGSLARQALELLIALASQDILKSLIDESQDLDAREIVEFLLPHLRPDKRYFFIIDGIEDCESGEIHLLIQEIGKLCRKRTQALNILVASRPELGTQLFRSYAPNSKVSLGGERTQADINQYIASTLDRCLADGELQIGDENLILSIMAELQSKSCGMFLWARLMIEEICAQSSDDDIIDALNNLPNTLSDLFDTKVTRIKSANRSKAAIKTLQFCGVSRRPLTLEEFQELLSVAPEQTCLNRGGMPNNMESLISDCNGLVFVDEEERTVHYVHHSFRNHLFTNPPEDMFIEANLDDTLGILCLTYLNFSNFKSHLEKIRRGSGISIDPLNIGTVSTNRSISGSASLARKLIRQKQNVRHFDVADFERTLKITCDPSSSSDPKQLSRDTYPFLEYARANWIFHLTRLEKTLLPRIWQLFCRHAHSREDTLADRPWETRLTDTEASIANMTRVQKTTMWAYDHAHPPLYSSLVQSDIWTEDSLPSMLIEFIERDRPQVISFILEHTDIRVRTLTDALVIAAGRGNYTIMTMLLKAGAQVNSGFRGFGKPDARIRGIMDLRNGSFTRLGSTALHNASEHGQLRIVEKLIGAGAYIDEMNPTESLENGRQLSRENNRRGGHTITPASSEKQATLQREAGAQLFQMITDASCRSGMGREPEFIYYERYGWTALCFAAANGHIHVVKTLLASGANAVYATKKQASGMAAIEVAQKKNYVETVECLKEANVNLSYFAEDSTLTDADDDATLASRLD